MQTQARLNNLSVLIEAVLRHITVNLAILATIDDGRMSQARHAIVGFKISFSIPKYVFAQ